MKARSIHLRLPAALSLLACGLIALAASDAIDEAALSAGSFTLIRASDRAVLHKGRAAGADSPGGPSLQFNLPVGPLPRGRVWLWGFCGDARFPPSGRIPLAL